MRQNWKDAAAHAAAENFDSGYNCAESVFLALGDTCPAESIRNLPAGVCTGFGGGIGSTGRCCGAVTGAVCFLGLLLGRKHPDDDAAYQRTTDAVGGLLEDFCARYDYAECSKLTGYDPSDPHKRSQFFSDPDRKAKCRRMVQAAAQMAVDQSHCCGFHPK